MSELTAGQRAALRSLPPVSGLLEHPKIVRFQSQVHPEYLSDTVRRAQERARTEILAGGSTSDHDLVDAVVAELALMVQAVPTVVNGTGVLVHTNLGRSPVSRDTAEAMSQAASHYLPLELDLGSGERGGRGREVELLMRALTGAENTLVVNNNAAAVSLTLAALTAGRKVIVSRGEAVEIGGGFRIPDVMRQSGAILSEVGTTNRSYVRDYEAAIDDETAALLKVHASNFSIIGFTAQPELRDLSDLAKRHNLYMIEDVGSGCLLDTTRYGLSHEPTLADSLAAGADVVTASGDKLLGGPQAGLIAGKASVVDMIRRHPMARAVRVDKTVQAGIGATLRHYLRGEAEDAIPIWWAMSRDLLWLRNRVETWIARIDAGGVSLRESQSVVGGGSLPGMTLPSAALAIETTASRPQELARRLRLGEPHVFPRIEDDVVLIDARSVLQDEDNLVVQAVRQLVS